MKANRITARLSFSAEGLDLEPFIPVFHAWIRECKLADEVMVDVADYAHVPGGPGVLLVCHEGHYVVQRDGDRFQLCYHRKRGGETDDLEARLAVPLRRLVAAARLLEGDPDLPGIRFDTGAIELEIRSRLHVSNDAETRAELVAVLQAAFPPLAGGAVELEAIAEDPREPFAVRARLPSALPLAQLVA